ncbi:hypothetical protein V7Z47_28275, partial [Priestia megaterium]
YHYIAKNPSSNKDIGIFEVLSTPELKENFYWESLFLNRDELDGDDFIAPKETSIAGDKHVNYKKISASNFTIETDSPVASSLNLSWIPSVVCSECGGAKKVRNGKYGYYLKCPKHCEQKK